MNLGHNPFACSKTSDWDVSGRVCKPMRLDEVLNAVQIHVLRA